MISGWTIYWATKLDSIREFTMGMSIGMAALLVAIGIILLTMAGDGKSEEKRLAKYVKSTVWKLAIIPLIGALITVTLPTTKQMAAMLIIPPVANSILSNEELKQLPNNVVSLANDWLKELKPNKDLNEKGK